MAIGLIGGSGLSEIVGLDIGEEILVPTPYGNPSSAYKIGRFGNADIVFLPRHGVPHSIPPHKVNYRANVWGLKSLGVERIIAVSAVGGISSDMVPGAIVLLDQIIDMTHNSRPSTFYDGDKVVHVDFTNPYCPEMTDAFVSASERTGVPVIRKGTYVCVNGPRLETAAEINFFSRIRGDVVGMTAMPEAVLARELEVCFSGISVVTNHAAGISGQKLTTIEVIDNMHASMEKLRLLIKVALAGIPHARSCLCRHALNDSAL